MREPVTNPEPVELALRALAWALAEPERAARFLRVTGLDPDDLRARADAPEVLSALLGFLEAHQPDLLACADALEVKPEQLVAAHERLDR